MNPGLELRIEKLQPFLSHMEDQRATKKQVLEAEAGRHASEVKKVSNVQREIEKGLLLKACRHNTEAHHFT